MVGVGESQGFVSLTHSRQVHGTRSSRCPEHSHDLRKQSARILIILRQKFAIKISVRRLDLDRHYFLPRVLQCTPVDAVGAWVGMIL